MWSSPLGLRPWSRRGPVNAWRRCGLDRHSSLRRRVRGAWGCRWPGALTLVHRRCRLLWLSCARIARVLIIARSASSLRHRTRQLIGSWRIRLASSTGRRTFSGIWSNSAILHTGNGRASARRSDARIGSGRNRGILAGAACAVSLTARDVAGDAACCWIPRARRAGTANWGERVPVHRRRGWNRPHYDRQAADSGRPNPRSIGCRLIAPCIR